MDLEIAPPPRNMVVKRLHLLLILSFINTGLMLFSELITAAMLPDMITFVDANRDTFPNEMALMIDRTLNIPQWYFLILAVLDAVSVTGLVMMWRLRKNGFHCYALSKLLLIMMPLLFLDRMYIGIGNIMIAVLVIAYYYVLMRGLNMAEADSATEAEADENADNSDNSDSTNESNTND